MGRNPFLNQVGSVLYPGGRYGLRRESRRNPFLNQVGSVRCRRETEIDNDTGRNPFLNQVGSVREARRHPSACRAPGSQSLLKSGRFGRIFPRTEPKEP